MDSSLDSLTSPSGDRLFDPGPSDATDLHAPTAQNPALGAGSRPLPPTMRRARTPVTERAGPEQRTNPRVSAAGVTPAAQYEADLLEVGARVSMWQRREFYDPGHAVRSLLANAENPTREERALRGWPQRRKGNR